MFQVIIILIILNICYKKIMEIVMIDRYYQKYEIYYETAISEIQNGEKESCWSWYIFPQIIGLIDKPSSQNKLFAIKNKREAIIFLKTSYLRNSYVNILNAVVEQLEDGNTLNKIFKMDDVKVISSVTLFGYIACEINDNEIRDLCIRVIELGNKGVCDWKTIKLM